VIGGRYWLERRIADGGMGHVWCGHDERLSRPVAVKFLRSHLGSQLAVRRRVEGEARAAARLVHPNVVSVYDTGTHDGLPYLVMELLPGRTLTHEVAEGPLGEDRVRALAGDILGALGAAHAAGIVHRDVKPGNVLLTEDGRAKVGDFGIAKVADAAATQTAEVIGTVAYMAPERLEGRPATTQSDLYSAGAVLYEALTGRPPFRAAAPAAFLDAIRTGDRPAVHELRPDVHPSLAAAIERALSPDPVDRFGSADEMAAAVTEDEDTEPVVPTQPLDATAPLPPAEPASEPRRIGRMAVLAWAALAVAAFVVAFLVATVIRGPSPDGPAEERRTETGVPPPLEDALDRLEEAVRP
jgi:serine/threonine protein kinase